MSIKTERVKCIISILLIWRNIPAFIMYAFADKKTILEDLDRIIKFIPFTKSGLLSLNYALLFNKPYRSIFKFRIVHKNHITSFLSWLLPKPLPSIEISGNIGGVINIP